MNTNFKKIITLLIIIFCLFLNYRTLRAEECKDLSGKIIPCAKESGISVTPNKSTQSNAEEADKAGLAPYKPLARVPGIEVDETGAAKNLNLPSYIRVLVRIAIGLIGVLSVVMIIIGGVQYMSTDAFSGKEDGKERVTQALKGLVLAVAAVFVLRTINPQLITLQITDDEFNKGVEIKASSIVLPSEIEGDSRVTNNFIPTGSSKIPPGVFCPGGQPNKNNIAKIATSFVGKNTYRYGGERGGPPYPLDTYTCEGGKACKTFCPEGTTCHDCSSYVNQVLTCAGFKQYDNTTNAMTKNPKSEKIQTMTPTEVNGKQINPGDLLFWDGHVVMYIGNGKTTESFGGNKGRQKGNSIAEQSADHYWNNGHKNKMYIYRLP